MLRLVSQMVRSEERHAPAGPRRAAQVVQQEEERGATLAGVRRVAAQLTALTVQPAVLGSAADSLSLAGLSVAAGGCLVLARQVLGMLAALDTAAAVAQPAGDAQGGSGKGAAADAAVV
jgi:hypothetical protein